MQLIGKPDRLKHVSNRFYATYTVELQLIENPGLKLLLQMNSSACRLQLIGKPDRD